MLILNKYNTRERERERERESPWSRLFLILQVKRLMGYAIGVPMGLVHIHVLKYCQHARSSFLSRDIPLNLMLENNIAGLGEIDQAVQHAILDRVITNFRQQPQLVKDWCTWILQIPHQRVGFGIIPTSTSGITALRWTGQFLLLYFILFLVIMIILLCISG